MISRRYYFAPLCITTGAHYKPQKITHFNNHWLAANNDEFFSSITAIKFEYSRKIEFTENNNIKISPNIFQALIKIDFAKFSFLPPLPQKLKKVKLMYANLISDLPDSVTHIHLCSCFGVGRKQLKFPRNLTHFKSKSDAFLFRQLPPTITHLNCATILPNVLFQLPKLQKVAYIANGDLQNLSVCISEISFFWLVK